VSAPHDRDAVVSDIRLGQVHEGFGEKFSLFQWFHTGRPLESVV